MHETGAKQILASLLQNLEGDALFVDGKVICCLQRKTRLVVFVSLLCFIVFFETLHLNIMYMSALGWYFLLNL